MIKLMKTRAIHVVQLELAVHVSWWKSESEVAQLCPTLWDRMDCSLPGSSVHGIFKTRILKWVAISFSRRSSLPRDWTQVSHIVGRHFTVWATRELPSWWDYTLSQSSAILRYSPPWKKAQWTQWIFMLGIVWYIGGQFHDIKLSPYVVCFLIFFTKII